MALRTAVVARGRLESALVRKARAVNRGRGGGQVPDALVRELARRIVKAKGAAEPRDRLLDEHRKDQYYTRLARMSAFMVGWFRVLMLAASKG